MTKKTWSNLDLSESFEVAQRELDRILEPKKDLTTEFTKFQEGYFEGISIAKVIIDRLQEKTNA